MNELYIRKLAESWIKMHHSDDESIEYKDNFWSYSQLCDLCEDDPELCFNIIEQIRALDNSDIILSNLAAGPLEDLLSNHGEYFIGRIEYIAISDPQMKKLLGLVWQNSIPNSIWKRIKVIAGKSF